MVTILIELWIIADGNDVWFMDNIIINIDIYVYISIVYVIIIIIMMFCILCTSQYDTQIHPIAIKSTLTDTTSINSYSSINNYSSITS